MKEFKSEITKREQMILLLKKSGWYKGRCIDISAFEQQCMEEGIDLFDSAKKFFKEFMGIDHYVSFKYIHPCEDIGECDNDYTFYFETKLDNKIYYNKQYQQILDFIDEDCFYIGQTGYYYPAVVAIGRSGKLYFKHDYNDKVQVFDNLIDSMLWELEDMNIVTSSLYKVEEDEHYYNDRFTVIDDIVEFERIYKVDLNKFNTETYDALEKVYQNLPSYIESPKFFPLWYGDEEKGDRYFITVTYDMSGLQFWGELPIYDFYKWENKFHELIQHFPFKYN